MAKLVSILCPAYNEEECIESHYKELSLVTAALSQYDFEFIYTDNHSTDKTFDILQKIASHDKRVKIFRFSRNFGYQNSIFTAYQKCSGDISIEYDADLEDPPSLLPQFLEKWEMGYKIVYEVRKKRKENIMLTAMRKLFYRIIRRLSETDLPNDAGDFMLLGQVHH